MDSIELTRSLKEEAHRLGFGLAGACPAVGSSGFSTLKQWLAAGYAGEMHYLPARLPAYEHPRHVLDGCRSLLLLGTNYRTAEPATPGTGYGRISRYAWNIDYHQVIRERLGQLVAWHKRLQPQAAVRGVVDTAPLLEREFAQLAGLGWIGKNTLLLNKQQGSWFFLAALLTEAELAYDSPREADHCGTCRACLDACPTQAFVAPYVLDARRCLSYTTIEHRGAIDTELRAAQGDWLFGCDVCQEVCPWNRKVPQTNDACFTPATGMNPIELTQLLHLGEEGFRQHFRQTPLWRAKRRGLLRNAAIVLGNQRGEDALRALVHGLNDVDPLVRGACAWALGQFGNETSRQALQQRRLNEHDKAVCAEIDSALQQGSMEAVASCAISLGSYCENDR